MPQSITGAIGLTISGGHILGITKPVWPGGEFSSQFWFNLDQNSPSGILRVVAPSTSGNFISGDSVYFRVSGDFSVTDYSWPFSILSGRSGGSVTGLSSNHAVLVPTTGNPSFWTYQNNGEVILSLISATYRVSGTVTAGTSVPTTDTFLQYQTGSLAYAITTGVDVRILGKIPSGAIDIYSTQNHSTSQYIRNTGCWAYPVNLTPISPWNSNADNYRAGTLVTPKHVLFAAHYFPSGGSIIRFVTSGNVVVNRAMTGVSTLPTYSPYYPDIAIGVLDSEVPNTIDYARVLPDNYISKFSTTLGNLPQRLPAIALDFQEKALITDVFSISAAAGTYGAMINGWAPTDATRLEYYEPKIGGDSSNPFCLIIDGKLVIMTAWTFGGFGAGTNIAYHRSAINTLISGYGTGYQLSDVNLSGYPNYP